MEAGNTFRWAQYGIHVQVLPLSFLSWKCLQSLNYNMAPKWTSVTMDKENLVCVNLDQNKNSHICKLTFTVWTLNAYIMCQIKLRGTVTKFLIFTYVHSN